MNEEYHTKLQQELEAYHYHKDYVHSVDGLSIDIPMIYNDASSIMYFMPISIKKAMNFIQDKRIKPVSIFMDTTLLAINIFKYRKSAAGSFNEFTFSIPVMMNRIFNIPILPLIFDQRFKKLGFYVIQLGASNILGRRHIEDIWGYPTYKKDLDISITSHKGRVTSMIKDNNEKVIEISESLPINSQFKFGRKKFSTYFTYNQELRCVRLNTFLYGKTWVRTKDFFIKIGNNEIGNMLKELGVKRKIATTFYPYAVEIADKAISI